MRHAVSCRDVGRGDCALWLVLVTHGRTLPCECSTIRGVERYSWQQAFLWIWKSFGTISKEIFPSYDPLEDYRI